MTTAKKRGRPRKNAEPQTTIPPSTLAMQQINAALDHLALARDYAITIKAGDENPHDFVELAGAVHKCICEAGTQLERGLCGLGLLAEGPKSGYFVEDLKQEAATQ